MSDLDETVTVRQETGTYDKTVISAFGQIARDPVGPSGVVFPTCPRPPMVLRPGDDVTPLWCDDVTGQSEVIARLNSEGVVADPTTDWATLAPSTWCATVCGASVQWYGTTWGQCIG